MTVKQALGKVMTESMMHIFLTLKYIVGKNQCETTQYNFDHVYGNEYNRCKGKFIKLSPPLNDLIRCS